jgi:hypothetical protein
MRAVEAMVKVDGEQERVHATRVTSLDTGALGSDAASGT